MNQPIVISRSCSFRVPAITLFLLIFLEKKKLEPLTLSVKICISKHCWKNIWLRCCTLDQIRYVRIRFTWNQCVQKA